MSIYWMGVEVKELEKTQKNTIPVKPAQNGAAVDAELVRLAREGDKRAFVEIVARYQGMVCGVALGILGDFAASEDAGQEAFLIAWRKIGELRDPERLRCWLGQIARNAALGQLRRNGRNGGRQEGLENAAETVDESPGPDESAATEEETARNNCRRTSGCRLGRTPLAGGVMRSLIQR